MAGRLAETDMDADAGKGGSWFRSYGGGGSPSEAVGEFELLRTREPSEGENKPLGNGFGPHA